MTAEACSVGVPGGPAKQAFVISLLQSVTEVMGLRSVSEVGVQTAQYDSSPLSLALQKLEETYLKQSQVCLRSRSQCWPCCWALKQPQSQYTDLSPTLNRCVHTPKGSFIVTSNHPLTSPKARGFLVLMPLRGAAAALHPSPHGVSDG